MNNEQILIPEGWTYFSHRTNTEKWEIDPFENKIITVKKIMSVVTESEIYGEVRDYGINHLQGYSIGKGTPFEIRCLICKLPYLQSLDDNNSIKNIMLKEFYYDRRNYGGVYGQRHHSIPPEEELVVIKVSDYDEVYQTDKKVIWTIPRRFMEAYIDNLNNNGYRVIDLTSPEKNMRSI